MTTTTKGVDGTPFEGEQTDEGPTEFWSRPRLTVTQMAARARAATVHQDATALAHSSGAETGMAKAARATRITGVVKTLKRAEGFGYLKAVDDGLEYFFHRTALTGGATWDTLNEGQQVTFVAFVPMPAKGPRADKVQLIDDEE